MTIRRVNKKPAIVVTFPAEVDIIYIPFPSCKYVLKIFSLTKGKDFCTIETTMKYEIFLVN